MPHTTLAAEHMLHDARRDERNESVDLANVLLCTLVGFLDERDRELGGPSGGRWAPLWTGASLGIPADETGGISGCESAGAVRIDCCTGTCALMRAKDSSPGDSPAGAAAWTDARPRRSGAACGATVAPSDVRSDCSGVSCHLWCPMTLRAFARASSPTGATRGGMTDGAFAPPW